MKFKHILLTISFFLFLSLLGLYSIMAPDREISDMENRGLAQIPEITKDSVLSGTWFKEFEAYFTDQFFKRDKWVELYTLWEMKMNKTFVNGYHVTKEGWIMAQPSNSFYKEELESTALSLNEFGQLLHSKGTELYYFPMPAKVFEMADLLPSYVSKGRGMENTEFLLSKLEKKVVNSVNVSKKLNREVPFEEKKSYYFKTDHHWNIKGAFYGFETMAQEISKKQPLSKVDINEDYVFSCEKGRELRGSWNRKLHWLVSSEDDIPCYYQPNSFSLKDMDYYNGIVSEKNKMELTDYYATGIEKDLQKMEYHDAYANNYPELNIVNNMAENQLKALLIKDSYANPLVPHISSLFKETTIFDPRYDKKRSVNDIVNTREFDVVIILYNSNNLIGDMYDFQRPAE